MGACLIYGIIAGCIFLPLGQVLQWTSVQIMQHLPQLHWQPEEQSASKRAQRLVVAHRLVLRGTISCPVCGGNLFPRNPLSLRSRRPAFRGSPYGHCYRIWAVHMNLNEFPAIVCPRPRVDPAYEKTNNLMAPIAAHSLFNAVNFVMLLLQT